MDGMELLYLRRGCLILFSGVAITNTNSFRSLVEVVGRASGGLGVR